MNGSLQLPPRIIEIISYLRFIAKIKPGEKINVRDLYVRDNDSLYQRVMRTLHNVSTQFSASDIVESKEATMRFVQTTVNETIQIIQEYMQSSEEFERKIGHTLITNLKESCAGIQNLASTYREDRKFTSDAEAVLQTLAVCLENLDDAR